MTNEIATASRKHGGALDAAMAAYGGRRADWLDLSTGINPAPPPIPPVPPHVWARLPEAKAEARLIEAARAAYRAPIRAGIVAAPGSQALISLLPYLFQPTCVAVLHPTYSEHARSFHAAGHRVAGFGELEDIPSSASIVVIVNPNNPDGKRFAPADLLALSESLAKRGGLLVVDEAFADCEPGLSMANETGRDGLLVHRSFGKVFGLAGVRLGFALTSADLAGRLGDRLGPWAVSGPALAIGTMLLGDADEMERLRRSIAGQAALRDEAVDAAGFRLVGRTGLFATVRVPEARDVFERLCRRHILTRPFADRPDWLRLGNPANHTEADRLRDSLADAVGRGDAAGGAR